MTDRLLVVAVDNLLSALKIQACWRWGRIGCGISAVLSEQVFRIRIDLNTDPDPAF